PEGQELGLVPVVVRAGGAAFFHYNTFHGSGPNTASVHRRAVISHLVRADTRFHPEHVDPVYSRYRRVGDLDLDESFFPIVWTRDGYRTGWLSRLGEPACSSDQGEQLDGALGGRALGGDRRAAPDLRPL